MLDPHTRQVLDSAFSDVSANAANKVKSHVNPNLWVEACEYLFVGIYTPPDGKYTGDEAQLAAQQLRLSWKFTDGNSALIDHHKELALLIARRIDKYPEAQQPAIAHPLFEVLAGYLGFQVIAAKGIYACYPVELTPLTNNDYRKIALRAAHCAHIMLDKTEDALPRSKRLEWARREFNCRILGNEIISDRNAFIDQRMRPKIQSDASSGSQSEETAGQVDQVVENARSVNLGKNSPAPPPATQSLEANPKIDPPPPPRFQHSPITTGDLITRDANSLNHANGDDRRALEELRGALNAKLEELEIPFGEVRNGVRAVVTQYARTYGPKPAGRNEKKQKRSGGQAESKQSMTTLGRCLMSLAEQVNRVNSSKELHRLFPDRD